MPRRTDDMPAEVASGAGPGAPSAGPPWGGSIGFRLIASFGAIVLLMIAAEAVAISQFSRMAATTQHIAEFDEAALAAFRVHFDIATFRDRVAAVASTRAAPEFPRDAGAIREKFLQDVEAAARLLRANSDIDAAELSGTLDIVRVTLLSQLDTSVELGRAGDWNGIQLRLQSQIPALLRFSSQLVEEVDRQVMQRRSDVLRTTRRAQERFLVEGIAVAVLILLGATALGWYITRTITVPLSLLTRGAEALARGDFGQQVAVGGRDELAALARAFDHAARQLQELYQDLQRSQQTLREVVNTIPAHVWTATADGSVDFANERVEEFTGLSGEELLGSDWELVLHPDDRARFGAEWRAAVTEGRSMESEVRVRRRDGRHLWFIVRNVPVRDQAERVIRWYGSAIEIEDRRRAEQERERLHQLEVEFAHINRMSMLGELAASIAHEIKQPLAAIVTNAHTSLRWLRKERPDLDEIGRAADRIVSDGERAAQVIDRLRSFYKKAPPQREPIDVNEVIQEIVVLLSSEAAAYRVSIRLDLAAMVHGITADRVQLQQVMMNLMLNAIEAMKETGGELTLRSEPEAGCLRISVSDTGIGLPLEKGDRIFDAFVTTKPQGSGMGLAISRSIIEAHGGRLWATPNARRGATFHFTLPVAAPAPGTVPRAAGSVGDLQH